MRMTHRKYQMEHSRLNKHIDQNEEPQKLFCTENQNTMQRPHHTSLAFNKMITHIMDCT